MPLNHEKIPNIKNLDKDYMNMSFDRDNRYSVPYFLVQLVFYIIKMCIQKITLIRGKVYITQNMKMIFY